MKFIHNDKMSLGWAIFVELAVHAIFAGGAFLLGGFLGDIALTQVIGPIGKDIGAWTLAIFVFGAAFQAFVLGEYMREHVQSYETTNKGDGSYERSWRQVRWLVAGIEISSLLFRCIFVVQQGHWVDAGSWVQAVIVAVLGGISLWYAFAQAKVIHASVNRPVSYDIQRAQDEAGRSLAHDAVRYTRKMTPEQKARFLDGDVSAIEEVAETDYFAQEQRRQAREQRQTAKQTRVLQRQQRDQDVQGQQEQAQQTASKILHPQMWRRGGQSQQPKQATTDFRQAQ